MLFSMIARLISSLSIQVSVGRSKKTKQSKYKLCVLSPLMHGVVNYPRKCAGGRLRKKVSINISKFPFCPDDCVLYRFVAFRLSVAVGRFHTSGFPCLSLYTLRRVARALPPIHRLQWEDSLLRVNFMPIHGQRMWRASPKKGELRF